MARWLGKAALQKGMSALPAAERVNYLFQRHVSRSLPPSEAGFRRKFDRAVSHLEAYAEHGPPRPLGDAVFYEFGAGWDLTIPLAYWALGVERQILVDIHSNLRFELLNGTIARLRRSEKLEGAAGRALRRPGEADVGSAQDLEERFGIAYVAPRDARATGLDAASVDFVSNTNTLEHIPAADIGPILAECLRLLRADGIMSSRIDLRDHYSYFDRSLSPYNFLRYSDRAWRLFNSRLLFQNRLRRPDYLRAFADAGFEVVSEAPSRPGDGELASLRELEVAPRYRGYALEDLAVTALVVVVRRASPRDPVSDTGPSPA
jgi:SAM-dependent methyltransferase